MTRVRQGETINEDGRRLVGTQKEVIMGIASQMEKVELADDAGKMPKHVEGDGLGFSRWRRSFKL